MSVFEKFSKPDLREQLGVAMRATNLKMTEDAQRAVDRIAALGAAQAGARRGNARLSAMLWRLVYDRDVTQRRPASILFAHHLRRRPEYHRWKIRSGDALVLRFSLMAVLEWEQRRVAPAGERASALGVPLESYWRHWPARFDFAKAELDRLESEVAAPLQKLLSRRNVRA